MWEVGRRVPARWTQCRPDSTPHKGDGRRGGGGGGGEGNKKWRNASD